MKELYNLSYVFMAIISLEMAFRSFILHGQFQNLDPNSCILLGTYYGPGIVNRHFTYFIHNCYNTHLTPTVTQLVSGKTGFSTELSVTLMLGDFPLTVNQNLDHKEGV